MLNCAIWTVQILNCAIFEAHAEVTALLRKTFSCYKEPFCKSQASNTEWGNYRCQ